MPETKKTNKRKRKNSDATQSSKNSKNQDESSSFDFEDESESDSHSISHSTDLSSSLTDEKAKGLEMALDETTTKELIDKLEKKNADDHQS